MGSVTSTTSNLQKNKNQSDGSILIQRFCLRICRLLAETVHSYYSINYDPLDAADDGVWKRFLSKLQTGIEQVLIGLSVQNEERLLDFLFKAKPNFIQFRNFNQRSDRFLDQLGSGGHFLQAIVIGPNVETGNSSYPSFQTQRSNLFQNI